MSDATKILEMLRRGGTLPMARPRACATPECPHPALTTDSRDGKPIPGAWCDACLDVERARRQRDAVAVAAEQVPKENRAVRFVSPLVLSTVAASTLAEVQWTLREHSLVTLLVGAAGRGKTLLASAVANEILHLGQLPGADAAARIRASRLRWASAMDLGTARREWPLGAGEPAKIRDAIHASFLVVDELGKEGDDEASKGAVWEVVYERHANGRPTLITTGIDVAALPIRYDGGMTRRLLEEPFAKTIHVKRRSANGS